MKPERYAYITSSVRITTLNKERGAKERKGAKEEARKEGPNPLATGRDRGSSKRGYPSFDLHIACANVKSARACRLPVEASGTLSSRGRGLGTFYERGLWKRASWARDKAAARIYSNTRRDARARARAAKNLRVYDRTKMSIDAAMLSSFNEYVSAFILSSLSLFLSCC